MPKSVPETLLGGKWGRCKNCKRRFQKTRPDKLFCTDKCRHQYNNYGRTPQAQMEGRLKSFMRTEEFKKVLRAAIEKEVRSMWAEVPRGMQTVITELSGSGPEGR